MQRGCYPQLSLGTARCGAVALAVAALVAALGCAHTVTVKTTPPGAMVTVNGERLGRSPVTFEDDSDPAVEEFVVVARLNGHETTERHLRRTRSNPWATAAVSPCCGSLGWASGAVVFVAGLILSPATLCVSGATGTLVAAVLVGTGCGWALITSPTLLLLQWEKSLPDEVVVELAPVGALQQTDSDTETWPPAFTFSPEEDGYWQNPTPEPDDATLPIPHGAKPEGAAPSSSGPTMVPASQPGPKREQDP